MSDWVQFEGHVTPMEWGTSVYTVLPLPDQIVAKLGNPKRVEGEIADHPINLAVTRAPVIDTAYLWTGKSLLSEIGIEPGEPVDVRLRPADPNVVETPPEIATALREADCTAAWEALSPGKRRGLIHTVETAKRAETKAKRIAALLEGLR